jgi:hypothetical protein
MSKLFAAAATLTALAVLATSATAFARGGGRDHRHGATAPAANSPPPAAARAKAVTPIQRSLDRKVRQTQGAAKATKAYTAAKQTRANLTSQHPNSAPTPGKSTQQK